MKRGRVGGGSSRGLPAREAFAPIEVSPCNRACPVGIDVKAYVAQIAQGRPDRAAAIVRERNPLPSACGRICSAPCERECRRASAGEGAVAIRTLKWFAVDLERDRRSCAACDDPRPVPQPGRFAVVGGGPAGLTAASDLARAGRKVTLFEASPRLGGLLAHGVPAFRLPREALDADVAAIVASGVEVRTGTRVDPARPERLLDEGFDAVVLAVGAASGFETAKAPTGALDAADFVRRWVDGERPALGKRVVVAAEPGGLTLGLAAARTARRGGADSVVLVTPIREAEAPRDEESWAGARRDGIEVRWGSPTPMPTPGKGEGRIALDTLLWATPRRVVLPEGAPYERTILGTIAVHPRTLATSVRGVFAAGEASAGPRGVIEAMAAGRRAARSAMRHVAGLPLEVAADVRNAGPPEFGVPLDARGGDRWRAPAEPAGRAWASDEPDDGPTEPEAVAEARRCLMCGPCEECRTCTPVCEFVLVDLGNGGAPDVGRLPRAAEGWDRAAEGTVQLLAAVVDADRCIACGLCAEVCPWNIPRIAPRKRGPAAAAIAPGYCRACGICAGACPSGAIRQHGWDGPDRSGEEVRP